MTTSPTSLADAVNLRELEMLASQLLPAEAWDYFAGGAEDERTVAENEAAYQRLKLRPRVLVDVARRSLATTVIGQPVALPVLLGPTSRQQMAHPDAEIAVARAAVAAGTIGVFATGSHYSIREIAEAAQGPVWFQLYPIVDREVTARVAANAEAAGSRAVVLTVTAFYPGRRERHLRRPLPAGPEAEMANLAEAGVPGLRDTLHNPHVPLTWADLAWVRSLTRLPLILKGIQTAEDALLAVEHGVDGIIVSNHGGRQLDGTRATIDTLPEVVDAVAGRVDVLVDGGIRRGTDVLKALALGAKAVLIARPVLWGLALGGQAGVARVLEMLRAELDSALAQAGVPDVQRVDRSLVAR